MSRIPDGLHSCVAGGSCPICNPAEPGDIDSDGFMLDDNMDQIGHCNNCGEEALVTMECCEDGEIEPWV